MSNEDKLFELMEKMYGEIIELKKGQANLEKGQASLEKEILEIKGDVKDLKAGQVNIENKLDDMEANNASRHIETDTKINQISKDIKFLKHKEFQNEQELFDLKDQLKVIK